MATGVVHLLFGLAGSGKTTLARGLCADGGAVRFTLDEWMIRLYPQLSFDCDEYGERAAEVREVIWSVAEQVLRSGVDVVLDWNSWSVERRRWATTRAAAAGASVVVHRLTTPLEVASERATARTRAGAPFAHPVTQDGNRHLAALMQEPSAAEGLRVVEH